MTSKIIKLGVFLAAVLISNAALSASYMKFDGVDGESKSKSEQTAGNLKGKKPGTKNCSAAANRSQCQNNLKQMTLAKDPKAKGPNNLRQPEQKPAALLLPAVQAAREAARRTPPSSNNSSSGNKGGNAETTWKVEKGEK